MPIGDENAVKVFSNPAYAISFMQQTLVKPPPISSEKSYGQAMDMTLVKLPDTCTLNGNAIQVYVVMEAEQGSPSFKSYLCPYSASALSYTVLGNDAKFCFTYAMDGCTFGVGTPAPTGEVIVSHGNAIGIDSEGTGDQANKQKQFATDFHQHGLAGLLEPSAYRPPNSGKIATTFGVRDGASWKFYYLSYSIAKKTWPFGYLHHGVHQFV